ASDAPAIAVMEVPLRPCALNSSLAASSRRERMLWPALRVARALWRGAPSRGAVDPAACGREALRARAPGLPLPSSLTLAKRALRFFQSCLYIIQIRSLQTLFGEGGVKARLRAEPDCQRS